MLRLNLPEQLNPLPVNLRAISVQEDGQLVSDAHTRPIRFQFDVWGVHFAARIDQKEGQARLSLAGNVGALPYTAQSFWARTNMKGILERANAKLGSTFHVSDSQTILWGGLIEVPKPITPDGLVAALVRFLLPGKPYLDLMRMVAMSVPPAPKG